MIEIDGYTDVERIGHGGLGDVHRATRESTGATVAIKVLRDVSDESIAWHRTSRELTALVALAGHAHVVQLLELLELPDGPALVMEYASGGSVADLMRRRDDTLTTAEAVLVGRHAAAALVAAHARGIIHRDIKPQNLLIDAYGQVKLCDFGIAALTRSEEFRNRTDALSLRYASPEDLDEDEVGPASDIYSLGATLLHLARGAPPTLKERLAPWRPPASDDPHVAGLDAVIAACLHPDPAERPSAAEVFDDLERLGWAIEERQRALVFDPPLDVAIIDDPTDRRPDRVAGADPADPGRDLAPSGSGSPGGPSTVSATSFAASIQQRDAAVPEAEGHAVDDGSARRLPHEPCPAIVPRPLDRAPRWRPHGRRILAAVAVAAIAVIAFVLLRPSDAAAPVVVDPTLGSTEPSAPVDPGSSPAPTGEPPSTSPATASISGSTISTVERAGADPSVEIVDRPDGLDDLTGSVRWPTGPVGECLVQREGADELASVPCAQPHDLQRYVAGTLSGPVAVADHDGHAIGVAVAETCRQAFAAFVGVPEPASSLHVSYTAPSAGTWASGDRSYQCLLGLPGRRLVGDAEGSGA